ncbi:MAG TPA: CocE/NonD family hydrolase [Candidatus Eisenbacteria bacterium]|nr:CocE/NonD family hydrolase [Candidatus Eisenbacteria bacterium]
MKYKLAIAITVPLFFVLGTACVAASGTPQKIGPGYDIEMSRMIPLRDGVQLEAWIFKPSGLQSKAPTVLCLTQYEIDGMTPGRYFTERGYVYAQVYVRGRGRSGGEKSENLGLQVGRDGYDVVEWIAAQPWSDGHVVMYGASFFGMTQWRTAAQVPPHLAGIAPYVPIYPGWDVPNTNGIPQAWSAVIMADVSGRSHNTNFVDSDYWQQKMLEHYAHYRSFRDLDDAIGLGQDDWWMTDDRGQKISFMKMWLDHVGDEAFNLVAEPKPDDFARMNFPVLTATGYFDDDQPGSLRYYRRHIAYAPRIAAQKHFLVMGPWDHSGTHHPVKEIEGLAIPESAILDMDKLRADWYDWVLGRGPQPALLKDRVTYFMMGADEWRYAPTLEAATSGEMKVFLEGTPEDVFHSGYLKTAPAGAEAPTVLISNPHELPELDVAKFAANENLLSQFRAYQKRAITFHSEPFARDTEIAGQMRLNLTVQSDAPDFDLWAQVLMVLPDGSAVKLGEDIRRARFRNSYFKSELLKPDQVAEIPFQFYWIARRIPAGARLRLTLAPLNSPAYQKNYNTGGRIGYERIEDARIANIKIFHDAQRRSYLTLPLATPTAAMANH